jgi:hypothetical protein
MRPPANSVIKFFRWSSLPLLVFSAGCSSSGPTNPPVATIAPEPVSAPRKLPPVTVTEPETPMASDLGLVRGSNRVRVGDDPRFALAAFPKAKGGFLLRAGVPIDNRDVEIEGWEADHSSFAMLTLGQGEKAKIIMAMYSFEESDISKFNSVLGEHVSAFGQSQQQVINGETHYHFWNQGSRRLMVATNLDGRGKRGIYMAVGQFEVMNAVGMSYKQAEVDADVASGIFRRRQTASVDGPGGKP